MYESWINLLPVSLAWCVLYFVISYVLICIGIALSNRCGLPIIPTDLFPRELSQITKASYAKIKISFDAICLIVTLCMTFFAFGYEEGIGIGTVLAALTMGKVIGLLGTWLDRHFTFATFRQLHRVPVEKITRKVAWHCAAAGISGLGPHHGAFLVKQIEGLLWHKNFKENMRS